MTGVKSKQIIGRSKGGEVGESESTKKIEDELNEIQELIKKLKDILSSPKKILAVVKAELFPAHIRALGVARQVEEPLAEVAAALKLR